MDVLVGSAAATSHALSAHPSSHSIGSRGTVGGHKEDWAWIWPITSNHDENKWSYFSIPLHTTLWRAQGQFHFSYRSTIRHVIKVWCVIKHKDDTTITLTFTSCLVYASRASNGKKLMNTEMKTMCKDPLGAPLLVITWRDWGNP
jgi:hypothetical protein